MDLTGVKYPSGAEYLSSLMPDELTLADLTNLPARLLSHYDIMANDDNELMFLIKKLDAPMDKVVKPRMYYDGGAHAIFLKNCELAVVCDFIHSGVREIFKAAGSVLVAEQDLEKSKYGGESAIVEEYDVEVIHQQGVEALAEQLIKQAEGAKG